jgi:hypothetical protein
MIQAEIDALESREVREPVKGFPGDSLLRLDEVHNAIREFVIQDALWVPRDQSVVRVVARAGQTQDHGGRGRRFFFHCWVDNGGRCGWPTMAAIIAAIVWAINAVGSRISREQNSEPRKGDEVCRAR